MLTKEEEIAEKRYRSGETHNVSTFIDEDTIIAGYGKLDIDFEYPLPVSTIIEIYGTTSWHQRFKNLGLYRYKCINNETKEEAITPYYLDSDMEKVQKDNPNHTFKKIET